MARKRGKSVARLRKTKNGRWIDLKSGRFVKTPKIPPKVYVNPSGRVYRVRRKPVKKSVEKPKGRTRLVQQTARIGGRLVTLRYDVYGFPDERTIANAIRKAGKFGEVVGVGVSGRYRDDSGRLGWFGTPNFRNPDTAPREIVEGFDIVRKSRDKRGVESDLDESQPFFVDAYIWIDVRKRV